MAKSRSDIPGNTYTRAFKLRADKDSVDKEARTVRMSISSEEPYERYFPGLGRMAEILLHTKKAINMERAGSDHGLPIRIDHGGRLVGRLRDIKLRNKRLEGIGHFSNNSQEAREAFDDVIDEMFVDTSVQYEIQGIADRDDDDDNTVTVNRWMPVEAAIVAVPADASVGINRNREDSQVDPEKDKGSKKKKGDDLTIADFNAARKSARGEGFEAGREAEAERIKSIITNFARCAGRSGVAELQQTCIDEGTSAERSNELLLEYIASNPEPVTTPRRQGQDSHGTEGDIETTRDERDKWTEGVTQSLLAKGGLLDGEDQKKERREARQNEFFAMSLTELARNYLEVENVSLRGLTRLDLVGRAFMRQGYHGTSDFANVLENVAAKALLTGYEESEETWRSIVRIGSLSDFKAASRVNLSSFSDLELVLESDEFQQGHLSDLKETITLGTYGKIFSLSRQAIINDDLDAFTRIPRAMGRAADRNVGDIVYSVLTTNAVLNQDGVALFSVATHANLAGSGGAIDETTLDAGRVAMGKQTSPAPGAGETGATLNIRPRLLIVPLAKQKEATKAVRTTTAPVQGANTGDLTVNTFFNELQVVADARLDADSATKWYLSANPNIVDTIECAFLDGVEEPFLDSQDGWQIDGIEWKVRHDVAAAASDFRGLYQNPGA